MSRLMLLSKPAFQRFLDLAGFSDLSLSVLLEMDSFFEFVMEHGIALPKAVDLLEWSNQETGKPVKTRLRDLEKAMRVCLPVLLEPIAEAQILAEKFRTTQPQQEAREINDCQVEVARRGSGNDPWDPIAPPKRKAPVARSVSVPPCELPLEWQDALRRAARGLPGNGVFVSPSILLRMREKLCQLAWSAMGAGLDATLSHEAVEAYLVDLKLRCEKKKNSLRWATLRASAEELHRFGRFLGAPAENISHLSKIYRQMESKERLQLALKHRELARTGHTTDSVLDLADALGDIAPYEKVAQKRHRLRNAAAILALYAIAPLRNASATLVFGETLFWREGYWEISTIIGKTRQHSPKPFIMRLEPETGRFIDAMILGDRSVFLLPKLRHDVCNAKRQAFVLPDNKPAAPSYIPRIFKTLTGNSFTTTRAMIHTDEAVRNGEVGVQNAKNACHQKLGSRIHESYQLEEVSRRSIANSRAAATNRRANFLASNQSFSAVFSPK